MWFKGRAAVALDSWYEGDVEENLRNAREWLGDPELTFTDMAGRLNLVFAGKDIRLSDADDDHPEYAFDYPMDDHVLQGEEFETVIRRGYLEAIGLALEHSPPVPIKTHWLTGVDNESFEMHVSDGAHHVSVTLFVPGDVQGGSEHPDSPEGWKVTVDGGGTAQAIQTSGPPTAVPPSLRGATAS
jgi:hypothetical protein